MDNSYSEKMLDKMNQVSQYLKEGKSVAEIAKLMNCNNTYVYRIRRRINEKYVEENPGETLGPDQRKKTLKRYKTLRAKAAKEDRLEMAGEEDVSISGRQSFIYHLYVLQSYKMDKEIAPRDIDIIINAIEMHPKLVNNKLLKFLVINAYRREGFLAAKRMINELIETINIEEYRDYLSEYKDSLIKMEKARKIKELKDKGLDNTTISTKLSIPSAEVAIFSAKMDSMIFDDFR